MTDAPEEVIETNEADTSEDKATRMGWRPKEEFNGDEKRWVDAEEFLRRGEDILPIVRAEKKKLEGEVDKLRSEITEMRSTFAEAKTYYSKTEQRAYQAAMRDLEDRQADAVLANDLKAVQGITKEIANLSADMTPDKAATPYAGPDHEKAVEAWIGENPWYATDKVMAAAANQIASDLEQSGLKGAAQRAEVAKRIKDEFPHKFENPNRKSAAAVEGSTPTRKAGKTKADLPVADRDFMGRMVKQGLMTEAQYLKDYQW